ncbi:hypothetical protein AVL59_37135 [Streptomyces griseochromogenes]|uniref:Uncharacterized protein n=1 Tax=Streptomyces griseochromogenes TaxID=68214 RepID=A0A1B1B6T5_9ACTN|nr:hypothetical protein AVL59_37135 [Streptomyces griseochromogenes]
MWWPAMDGRQRPRAGPMAAAHSGGMAESPCVAPDSAPATAAVVSASRPMLTAVSTASRKSPSAAAYAPKARATASGARSVQG